MTTRVLARGEAKVILMGQEGEKAADTDLQQLSQPSPVSHRGRCVIRQRLTPSY